MPNMTWLYRRPLLDYWCDGEDTLEAVVTHVLVHGSAITSVFPTPTWRRSRPGRMTDFASPIIATS